MLRGHVVRITAAVAMALAVALTGCSSSGSAAAKKDVSITACKASPSPSGGHPTATGRIVNHSSKASLYTIHVKFKDASGNGAGDGVAAVARVDAAAQATWHATGTLNVKGAVTCALASVTRHLSP
jgi:hypothetical protein